MKGDAEVTSPGDTLHFRTSSPSPSARTQGIRTPRTTIPTRSANPMDRFRHHRSAMPSTRCPCDGPLRRHPVRSGSVCRTGSRSGCGLACLRRTGATLAWLPGPPWVRSSPVRRTGPGLVPVRPRSLADRAARFAPHLDCPRDHTPRFALITKTILMIVKPAFTAPTSQGRTRKNPDDLRRNVDLDRAAVAGGARYR